MGEGCLSNGGVEVGEEVDPAEHDHNGIVICQASITVNGRVSVGIWSLVVRGCKNWGHRASKNKETGYLKRTARGFC